MKLKIYNFVFETYEDEKDYYIDCDMNVINKDDNSVNPQCEVQLDQGWISIEDEKPRGNVIIRSEKPLWGGDIFSASYGASNIINGMFEWDFESIAGKVTHWMPLPNPPKF